MNIKSVAFRARARTIDHLGKGQIADCPTAVSELWKNAFDAYARDVALHIYDGDFKCAAIVDNGCGMTINQLIESWLVVGTDSKSKKKALAPEDRFGLDERKTQGEKGIGRLSSAFLAPVTFLVTKKINTGYSAALIDWRLFENTYLSLSDISVPITEFESLSDFEVTFSRLLADLEKNLCLVVREDISKEKQVEIRNAWAKYTQDQIEFSELHNIELVDSTENRIKRFCDNFRLNSKLLTSWAPLLDKVKELDGSSHGTAMFLLDVERELSLLANSGTLAKNNHELESINNELIETLRGFMNPFIQDDNSLNYEIKIFSKDGKIDQKLRQSDVFTLDDFNNLEHSVVGEFNEKGWFTGRVKAWGIDKGIIKLPPNIEIDKSGSKVGPFNISLGTFEIDFSKSSLGNEHANYVQLAEKYAGLMVFRDGLRVLPYGRVDNDFFEIEMLRSTNAGRYYWSSRRMFGQILITQNDNYLLKDKAGREGFIRNQAARELKNLVSSTLTALADRFFGTKSDERKELLEEHKKDRDLRKDAQIKARKQTQKGFTAQLKSQLPEIEKKLSAIKLIQNELADNATIDGFRLTDLEKTLEGFEADRNRLRTPMKPPKLGDNEDKYRLYRDMYHEYSAHVLVLSEKINKFESLLNEQSPVQSAKKHFERNQGYLNSQVNKHVKLIEAQLSELKDYWTQEGREDRPKYFQEAMSIVEGVDDGANLEVSLNSLDILYKNLADSFTVKYESITRALDRLQQGINLDAAFSMAEEEKAFFEDKAKSLQALAQLGISVEILAHELEALDSMVTTGLNSLPSEIKSSHPGFKTAYNAHKSLTQQIRFLSPLKLSGYQLRKEITGKEIQEHIEKFFRDRFSRQRVEVKFGSAFTKMVIRDLPSRIHPVFVNIINNAMYWVCLSEQRLIHIDVVGDEVIIANSGPPIDEDDIPRLFELFYSRRINGHGVGLYLCKENLAVAHHKIRYSASGDIQLIPNGANFVITFSGMEISQ